MTFDSKTATLTRISTYLRSLGEREAAAQVEATQQKIYNGLAASDDLLNLSNFLKNRLSHTDPEAQFWMSTIQEIAQALQTSRSHSLQPKGNQFEFLRTIERQMGAWSEGRAAQKIRYFRAEAEQGCFDSFKAEEFRQWLASLLSSSHPQTAEWLSQVDRLITVAKAQEWRQIIPDDLKQGDRIQITRTNRHPLKEWEQHRWQELTPAQVAVIQRYSRSHFFIESLDLFRFGAQATLKQTAQRYKDNQYTETIYTRIEICLNKKGRELWHKLLPRQVIEAPTEPSPPPDPVALKKLQTSQRRKARRAEKLAAEAQARISRRVNP